MEFNWEEFISNDKIAVHCETEEQAKDFCRKMHEHGLEWYGGKNYLEKIHWKMHEENTCYTGHGTYASLSYCKNNYTILEWSDYQKENNMNLELTNLTEEQKKQIIELAKKFEQENEVDKLDYNNDWEILHIDSDSAKKTNGRSKPFADDMFSLGLTAHTKEEAEKIRRRLLIEKELRDWAKKCKDPVDWESEQRKHCIKYDNNAEEIILDDFCNYTTGNIIFTDSNIGEQAIESIGKERLIRDYFGIDN